MYWQTLVLPLLFGFVNAESVKAASAPGVEETIQSPSLHDPQIYGIVVTIFLCFVVVAGVKMINRVAPAFLIPVLFSIFCIFLGIFTAPRHDAPREFGFLHKFHFSLPVCLRLFTCSSDWASYTQELISFFFFLLIPVTAGITGLSLQMLKDNWSSAYQRTNSAGMPDPDEETFWDFK